MPKKEPSNAELLGFIKENVATKSDLKRELGAVQRDLKGDIAAVRRDVNKLDTERAATNQRLSRVEFRTDKLLGPKVPAVDAEFEEQRRR